MYPVSEQFKRALIEAVRDVTMRVTLLDSSYAALDEITGPVIEGVVYVDSERATRRTSQLRVINEDGAYTPRGASWDQHGTNSYFWWNKMFRLEWGLKVGSAYQYVPLGTFMVDRFDVLVERGISVLNADGSDLWRKLAGSEFAAPSFWNENTTYNTIIKGIGDAAGVTQYSLDALDGRSTAEKQIPNKLFVEAGENRGDLLKRLCQSWGLDIYFDVWGRLHTEDLSVTENTLGAAPVWTFKPDNESLIVSISKSRSSDDLKNHIIVTGELDDGTPVVRGEVIDGIGTDSSGVTWKKHYTNSGGPTTVEEIGDRTKHVSDTRIRNSDSALKRAKREMLKAKVAEETLRMPVITIPMFEAGDVIAIHDRVSDTNDKYFLSQFDIPLRQGAQELFVKKMKVV
jgi:hypothetical protein